MTFLGVKYNSEDRRVYIHRTGLSSAKSTKTLWDEYRWVPNASKLYLRHASQEL